LFWGINGEILQAFEPGYVGESLDVTVHKGQFSQLVTVLQTSCVKLAQVTISECDIARQATHTGPISECADAEEEQISINSVIVVALKCHILNLISRQEIVRYVIKIR
jgi:hypothetical protein